MNEEGEETFSIALRKAGLDALESGMEILSNNEMFGSTWERKAKFIERICRERKIDWLILDTFFEIVGLDREQENGVATVNAAARPVRRIASQLKCAANLNRHERKSGDDVGTSDVAATPWTAPSISSLACASSRGTATFKSEKSKSSRASKTSGSRSNFAATPKSISSPAARTFGIRRRHDASLGGQGHRRGPESQINPSRL